MVTISLSSQLGSVLQDLEFQINEKTLEPAGIYANYLADFPYYMSISSPTVLELSSTKVRLQYADTDGVNYRLTLEGVGIGPVSTLEQLQAAIDQELATGVFSSIFIDRVVNSTSTRILEVNKTSTGYTLSSGTDVITVTGQLPGSFTEFFKLNDLLSEFDTSTLSEMTQSQRTDYFDSLSSFGVTGLSLQVNGTTTLSIGLTANQLSLSVGNVTFELNGTFPDNFGKIANAVFESDLIAMNDVDLDLNSLSGIGVSSIVIREGTNVLMTVTGPLTDEVSSWVTGLTIDGQVRAPSGSASFITIGHADIGLDIMFTTEDPPGQIVFGSVGEQSGDFVAGGSGDDCIYGFAGNDTLTGGFGYDVVDGGDGNDEISGGLGNDTLTGGAGADTLIFSDDLSSGGADNMVNLAQSTIQFTGEGLDLITGIENVKGMGGNDFITGDTGTNLLDGGDGNDTLDGGAGNDVLTGGDGADTATYASASSAVTVSLAQTSAQNTVGAGTDTLASIENLIGSAFNDALMGDANSNLLGGGGGNDTLEGAAGNDSLTGGVGVDTASYNGSAAAVTVNLSLTSAQNTVGAGTDTLATIENLIGSAYNDTLTGDANANVLSGGGGNDNLTGGGGNDTLDGGAGNDVLTGGDGTDGASYANSTAGVTVNLAQTSAQNTVGAGTDALATIENLIGSAFNDTLTGDSNANSLSGGNGNDILTAGTGNDTLDGGTGNDSLTGAAGDDTYVVDSSADVVVEAASAGTDLVQSSAATYTLTVNVENLTLTGSAAINGTGNTGNNILTGNSAANGISGGGGNDTIIGGGGNDTLEGAAGNDSLTGGDGVDTASYNGSSAAVTVNLSLTSAQNTIGAGTDTLATIENLIGSAYNDTLTGDANANVLSGGGGNDNLTGGGGNDTLDGAAGNDSLTGGDGTDTATYASATAGVTVDLSLTTAQATGGAGTDTLATIENLTASSFNDLLTGTATVNQLEGGAGADTLVGGAGADLLYGGDGDDRFVIAAFADLATGEIVNGGAGNDELRFTSTTASTLTLTSGVALEKVVIGTGTAASADSSGTIALSVNAASAANGLSMLGNAGANTLTGTGYNDSIEGGLGNDTLTGGVGNDTILGGGGNDNLTGGAGADTFVFNVAPNAASNLDTITDFTSGTDHINLAKSVMAALGTANAALIADAFWQGGGVVKGHDASDRIVYNTSTGALYYDADGSGSGAAVQLAQLGTTASHPASLSAADFFVF